VASRTRSSRLAREIVGPLTRTRRDGARRLPSGPVSLYILTVAVESALTMSALLPKSESATITHQPSYELRSHRPGSWKCSALGRAIVGASSAGPPRLIVWRSMR
jgi:hypothetical protein